MGQEPRESTVESSQIPDKVEVALTADRVRHWEANGIQHALLEGHAAAFKGDVGIRADRALVTIQTVPYRSGGNAHKIEIHAEGKVRRNGDTSRSGLSSLNESWHTVGDLKLTAAMAKDLITLQQAPPDLSRRIHLDESAPVIVAAKPAKKPAPVQAELPPKLEPIVPENVRDETVGQASAELPPPVVVKAEMATPRPENPVPVAANAKPKPVVNKDERPIRLKDPDFKKVQFVDGPGFPDRPGQQPKPPAGAPPADTPPPDDFGPSVLPPIVDAPGTEPKPTAPRPSVDAAPGDDKELIPLPGVEPNRTAPRRATPAPIQVAPIIPGSQRVTNVYAKVGPNFTIDVLPTTADGTVITVIRGGVNIVTDAPMLGTIDAEADQITIWRRKKPDGANTRIGPDGEVIESQEDPMEIYLEGHVIFRQDRRVLQGKDDQTVFYANRAYYDYRADRFLGEEAQVDVFAPGLIAPLKVNSPRIEAFHPMVSGPGGQMFQSAFQEIRATDTTSTGSRFPNPGYRFKSRSLDLKKVVSDNLPPNTAGDAANDDMRTTWRLDSRQNFFYMGKVPVFYWPRFVTDADDLDPPLRQIAFRTNNYFGQQVLLDFNGFKVFNLRKPTFIDTWNLDLDYLSARKAVGIGTELGWVGTDPIRDIVDPYHKNPNYTPSIFTDYFGYLDIWGLRDRGIDVLGPGPAVVTANVLVPGPNGKPVPAGLAGYQRISVPPFQDYRGRFNYRHMQSLLGPDADPFEDFRFNLEVGYYSDRQFLEQYYKRLYDTGLDHEILLYGIKQKNNTALTLLTEANPNNFNTETQWLPKLDYYRLGDSLLGDHFTYFQHSGVDYANIHTANEVNNKNVFAFIPFDPTSNTSGSISSGRAYTAHELDLPVNLGLMRLVPYVQGQAVGWNNQLDGQSVGRIWGAAGIRADILAHKAYPNVESELFNVHGINHKINFVADFRDAYSSVNLNRLAIQDDIDDNTYEFVRRYFAMTNFAGGLLPQQYDPRFLMLRRVTSPITGSTDIQGSIETIQLGIHQRLQTKRGPEGKRRIIDYVVFDLDTTYFPNANRDNFGKPWGQNMYNFEWYVGDRTSIVSYGWFEFFNIVGDPLYQVAKKNQLNPFGMNLTTTGININRPPRGNIFLGYTYFNTGPIQTSAFIMNYSYWMSPKWYTSFGTAYDFGNFGNPLLLGANASLTRVGADYFVSMGITAVPLQHSYMFAFEISPRLSPSLRLGSGSGLTKLDPRYAPVQ
jgi:hypothetical protein